MIEEIHITKVATYGEATQRLHNLRSINFLFGTNGCGKTTISRIIADPTAYESCAVVWRRDRVLETLVYNRDFVAQNFSQQLRGIFTLGDDAVEKLDEIEKARAKAAEIENQISQLKGTLGDPASNSGKHAELRDLRERFEAECWKIKIANDGDFQVAFSGVRNSRTRFCDKVLEETVNNNATLHQLQELKTQALTVFADNVARLPQISTINGADILDLEQHPILAKKIVGKEDVDIAALIRRLGNSDWVREGIKYTEGAGSPCPFCQKALDAELLSKVNAFFDEAYLSDIDEIERIQNAYSTLSDVFLNAVDTALISDSPHLDIEKLRAIREQLSSLLNLNLRYIDHKRKEPSRPVRLEPLHEVIEEISTIVENANAEIIKHNALVDNLANERRTLTCKIWKCLINERKDIIDLYVSQKNDIDKAISGLTKGIEAKIKQLGAAQGVLTELEKSVTSVRPTVIEINNILSSFGFTSFKLATAGEQEQSYRIIRSDGSDAGETLSEGEKSFVTFLYFYHLIRGSTTASGINVDRIVVFDDPVSSLDSDVLFIVSSLIKRVLAEAADDLGRVKQVFMLTHNIYFHKEVSFDPNRQKTRRTHETFWIVRKENGVTILDNHEENPIKTSYELLWQEVKSPNRSNLTIQNVLRRILEYYFKILGNMDKDSVIEKFQGRDRQICASLFSWINDGSHNFADDLYLTIDETMVTRYLSVFKKIFSETGHIAHYTMMMGIEGLNTEIILRDINDEPQDTHMLDEAVPVSAE